MSLSGSLVEKLQAVAAAGYDGVEIFETDLLGAQQSAGEIGAIIRDLGLTCSLFQPFRDFEGLDGARALQARERLKRKFAVMDALGTDLLLMCSSCDPASSGDRGHILSDLADAGDLAASHGKRIAYEALAWGTHIHDHRDAWALVRDVDHPALGLTLDSFHSFARQVPVSSIADIRGDKVFIVQFADAPRLDMDLLNWSRHFRCMPGQGDFDMAGYAAQLQRIGFSGFWSLEIFNDRFRSGSAKAIATDGLRGLRVMHDAASRMLGAPADLPPAVAPEQVEFIEFAASHQEAAEFARVFHALGFAPVARHRSKDVTRWTQGGINIVVNTEPEGLAHAFDIVHGAGVCAVGFATDRPEDVLARAQALSIEHFEPDSRPEGDWAIPALRGIGGGLNYIVDAGTRERMWAEEFPNPIALAQTTAPAQSDAPARSDLSRIDHIAQTMPYVEFLSWTLYYTALFGFTRTPQLEIADPMGIVYSQAVESPDKAVRITLNGSQAISVLSNRFLQSHFGAGVQHVAFATDDVFAAAEHAREAGLDMLEIGPNYYADIEARFGLAADLVARMAALNILYDRDADGEYFQFYSRAVARRVFFEVVERRGYQAYGAANSTIRLNAQAAHKLPETF